MKIKKKLITLIMWGIIVGVFFIVFNSHFFSGFLGHGSQENFTINKDMNSENIFANEIKITGAQHLDSNRNFISDVYKQVKELDNVWSETIPSGDYVRVTFQQKLTGQNGIIFYPRIISGNPIIEIYDKSGTNKIAEFSNIVSNQPNEVFLTNIQNSQDTFDLRVSGGSLQLDYIVDPLAIDGITGNITLTEASVNSTLTTTKAGDIIIVFAGGANAAMLKVNSISDSSLLTWTKRKANNLSTGYIEEWYAIANSTLTADKINVTWNSTGANTFIAYGISGAKTISPFDTNNSLPSTASTATTALTTNINSSNANDIVIGGSIAARTASSTCRTFTVGASYTEIATNQSAGTTCGTIDTEYKIVAATRLNLPVNETGSSATTTNYVIIGDAIRMSTIPTWSNNTTNGTVKGTFILHSVNWTDDTVFSGYIFSFDNGTGTFANDSFVTFTGTQNWSNVSKWVNTTASSTIRWWVWANNTANQINSTSIFTYTTTTAGANCWTYNAGSKLLIIPTGCMYYQSAGTIGGI